MRQARYKTLVDALAAEIRSGKLTPGTRLPTHRTLAAEHGLALVTASRVYAELDAMGLVTGETGRGTFVRDAALPDGLGIDQQTVASDMVDLSFNYPALPEQAEMLRAALRQIALTGDLEALLRYQAHGGRPHERAIVARYLACQGLKVDAGQVMITSGAQHGLTVVAMALLKPGDVVATDALTYPGMKVLAELLRLELLAVPADDNALDLHALERLCRQRRVSAVYVQPTVHNPLGWVMGLGQRQHLASLAQRHGLLLIEDAAYAFLAENAPPPLAALAPDSTVHVSGFSKNVATGLRVGYVAAPPAWAPRIERAIRASTWNTPSVMTALVCGWLDDGTVHALEVAKRKDARQRQALVAQALHGLPHEAHPASYFAWLPLPEGARADRVAGALLAQGISVSTAEPFCTAAQVPHAIRLALGSVDLAMLRAALWRVREVVALSGV